MEVHEKTVLLPLLPISFLFAHDALLAGWFSLLSTFRYFLDELDCLTMPSTYECRWRGDPCSMFFLLKKDGLVLPYFVLQVAFAYVGVLPFLSKSAPFTHLTAATSAPGYDAAGAPRQVVRHYVMVGAVTALVTGCRADGVLASVDRGLSSVQWSSMWHKLPSSRQHATLTSTTTCSRGTRAGISSCSWVI